MKKLLLSNFCLEFPSKYYTFLLVSNQDNIFYMCQVMTKLSHKQEVWNLFDLNEKIMTFFSVLPIRNFLEMQKKVSVDMTSQIFSILLTFRSNTITSNNCF